MESFKNWLAKKESSAFTRARRQYALGLGPDMPDAMLNSRSTCPPGYIDLIKDRKKKKKKKKRKKRKKRSKVHESKEMKPDYSIDKWLQAVGRLKDDLEDDKLKKKPEDDDLELGDEEFEDDEELEDDELEDDEEEDEELEDDEELPSLSPLALGRQLKSDEEIPIDSVEMPI